MNWLWLVAVGATDVQFPLWRRGPDGQWSERFRFSVPRHADVRALHEGLLALLRTGRLTYPDGPLPETAPDELGDVRLDLVCESDAFVACYNPSRFRLVPGSETVSDSFPVYCPKLQPLASSTDFLRDIGPRRDVTIVVLNTTRDPDPRTNPAEPVAAGPVVSRYLAERLNLKWIDFGGSLSEGAALAAGVGTWVDMLRGGETVENEISQQCVRDRLHEIIDAWERSTKGRRSIAISTGGGVPALKEVIERIAATRYGDGAIRLLLVPERGEPKAPVLRYSDKWSEREALRFHCTEALRQGDLISAYGLARRYDRQPWARRVKDTLGPLLELPCEDENQVGSLSLKPWELRACRVEACLSRGDVAAAIKALGAFLESAIWALLERSDKLREEGLNVIVGEERIEGCWPSNPELQKLLSPELESAERYEVKNLWGWPPWLEEHEPNAKNKAAATALKSLCGKYLNNSSGVSLKDVRNRLAHGAGPRVTLGEATDLLKQRGIVSDKFPEVFGNNLMARGSVKDLLAALGVDPAGGELFVAKVSRELALLQHFLWRD